jgi:hypothetical protein
MPTRVYLRSEGSAVVTPSDWEFPNQINPLTLPATLKQNTGSAMTTKTEATGTTSPTFRAMFRFVIGPLKAQSISGTVKAQIRGAESNAGANANPAISIKIIKPDGTDRAILCGANPTPIAADANGVGNEFVTTLTNAKFLTSAEATPISLTTQSATLGDFLVIEIGFRSATTTTRNIDLSYGNNSATDLPEDTSTTAANNPWVEFSGTIDFAQDVALPTIAASAVSAPSLAYAATLAAIAAGSALFAPTVAQAVTTPSIASTVVSAPNVDAAVVTAAIPSGSTVSAPSVAAGAADQALTGGTIASGASVSPPTVAYWIDTSAIAGGSLVFAPVLAAAVQLPALASGSSTSPPTLAAAVSLPAIAAGSSLSPPTLAAAVQLPAIAETTLGPPTLAAAVQAAAIAAGSSLGVPTLAGAVQLPAIPSGATLTPPAVAGAGAVSLPSVASTTLAAPSLATVTDVTGGTIPSGSTLSPPELGQETAPPASGPATALYPPALTTADVLGAPAIPAGATLSPPTVTLAGAPVETEARLTGIQLASASLTGVRLDCATLRNVERTP